MDTHLISQKRTARQAGILYLSVAVIAPFALMYIPSKIYVSGDIAATANNILDNEFLFRTGVTLHLITQVIMFLVAMFYIGYLKRSIVFWEK